MSRFHRMLPLLAVLLGVAALVTPMTLARAQEPAPQLVQSGADFATTTWQDPWDFSNSADLILDRGPSQGLVGPAVSGGLAVLPVAGGGYVSPLWGGYSGALHIGRDGSLPANMIDAATYTSLQMHVWVSSYTAVALQWTNTCPTGVRCTGGMTWGLHTGWNAIDRRITSTSSGGALWSGKIKNLRLAMTPGNGSSTVRVDVLRIYQPTSAGRLTWSSPDSSPATLWWTDVAGSLTTTESQHAGTVPGAAQSPRAGSAVATNVSGYPPRTYLWAVSDRGARTYVGQTVAQPLPVVDSPSVSGCEDYALRYLGHSWTFTSPGRLAGYGNATSLAFSSAGVLSATNAGPHRNDPYITLPIARGGIDGRVYHRLSVTQSYDGAFSLANAPGGGTMARVLWRETGHLALSQTNDLVTYSGKSTLSLDMAM
jgi:hypothetical protein